MRIPRRDEAGVDAVVGAELADGTLCAVLASGRRFEVAVTVPVEGLLRLPTGDVAGDGAEGRMLAGDRDCRPAALRGLPHGVAVTGPGVEAVLGEDGSLRMAPYARVRDPAASKIPFASAAHVADLGDGRPGMGGDHRARRTRRCSAGVRASRGRISAAGRGSCATRRSTAPRGWTRPTWDLLS